jgi:dTDP-4-dehydrorhamnose reductase
MKNILIIGSQGQVGWELKQSLSSLGTITTLDRQQLNLLDPSAITRTVREVKPAIIVNAAAYTAVDQAENEQELCFKINASAPEILAHEAKKQNALFIHYSTDYVFDGTSSRPYQETDPTSPLNVYGKSKLAGEQAIQACGADHLILRTSWVYGTRGKNFLLTMLRLAKERDLLKIVQDQTGAPTWSRTIAETTAELIKAFRPELSGIYNLTSSGKTTWFEFAEAIFRTWNDKYQGLLKIPKLLPITSEEYPTPAKRPKYSVLSHQKFNQAFDVRLPHWEYALRQCLEKS